MPWWAFAWRFREPDDPPPNPGHWWHWCIGSTCWWLDKLLERLPGGDLFEPFAPRVCNCADCLDLTDEVTPRRSEADVHVNRVRREGA